jgi:hypothetical protein
VWNAKKTGIFLDFQEEATDDFVIICHVREGIREADIYVVPTSVVEQDLKRDRDFYVAHPGKHGQARNPETALRVMRFVGEPKPMGIRTSTRNTEMLGTY